MSTADELGTSARLARRAEDLARGGDADRSQAAVFASLSIAAAVRALVEAVRDEDAAHAQDMPGLIRDESQRVPTDEDNPFAHLGGLVQTGTAPARPGLSVPGGLIGSGSLDDPFRVPAGSRAGHTLAGNCPACSTVTGTVTTHREPE